MHNAILQLQHMWLHRRQPAPASTGLCRPHSIAIAIWYMTIFGLMQVWNFVAGGGNTQPFANGVYTIANTGRSSCASSSGSLLSLPNCGGSNDALMASTNGRPCQRLACAHSVESSQNSKSEES